MDRYRERGLESATRTGHRRTDSVSLKRDTVELALGIPGIAVPYRP